MRSMFVRICMYVLGVYRATLQMEDEDLYDLWFERPDQCVYLFGWFLLCVEVGEEKRDES